MNPNLPPAVWLVLWLAATVFVCTLVAWLAYQAGWDHCERDRHPARHAAGDPVPPEPLPIAGQLSLFPGDDEDWTFFGGAQVEPRPGRDEYLLLVQQAVDRVSEESGKCDACESPEECRQAREESMEEFIVRQARETDDVISGIERETARLTRMMQNGSWPPIP
jgi:hypothetical protein